MVDIGVEDDFEGLLKAVKMRFITDDELEILLWLGRFLLTSYNDSAHFDQCQWYLW